MKARIREPSLLETILSTGDTLGITIEADASQEAKHGFTTLYFWSGITDYDRLSIFTILSGTGDSLSDKELKRIIDCKPPAYVLKAYGATKEQHFIVYNGKTAEIDVRPKWYKPRITMMLLNKDIAAKAIRDYMIEVTYRNEMQRSGNSGDTEAN